MDSTPTVASTRPGGTAIKATNGGADVLERRTWLSSARLGVSAKFDLVVADPEFDGADVADALLSYGRRIQYSVFERTLGETADTKLRIQLDGLIHHQENLFLDLGPLFNGRAREAVTSLGKLDVLPKNDSIVVG